MEVINGTTLRVDALVGRVTVNAIIQYNKDV